MISTVKSEQYLSGPRGQSHPSDNAGVKMNKQVNGTYKFNQFTPFELF